ncbi:MAG: hypothetical protein JST39_10160, partial [Bacteroidetes bacterium]|nr:hypothetical protein [Bacteroidota bacterium]
LEKNETTPLCIFPYCFMDANAVFEQKQSPQQAYDELMHYYNIIKKHQGMMITIWHNHLLSNEPELKGWREMYEIFMKENVYWDAYS